MSPSRITESIVEEAALSWLKSAGWQVAQGPDLSACDACLRATPVCVRRTGRHRQAQAGIAPDTANAERADYGKVVLERRLRDALDRLNPAFPAAALYCTARV